MRPSIAASLVLSVAALGAYLQCGSRYSSAAPGFSASYVGDAGCAHCHAAEAASWRGSHHALAMQKAEDSSVLGDFNDASFTYDGVTSRFFRRDGRFFINTDGPDGGMADYPIAYTFGVFPLQQYLIEFPDGRIQALSIAWDARPKAVGGQRWFHLYPNEAVRHGDPLHWTGLNQNWNFMCAECHATDLRKNYDATNDRFATRWSNLGVTCEACHGPGSRHLAWAQRRDNAPDKGLAVIFDERAGVTWTTDRQSNEVRRSSLQPLRPELETCGRCHSRRAELSEDWLPGRSLSNTHLISLLDPGLYHADGQIEDEVYEYAAFRQSKMFAKGVTCSDCHDPHSLERRAAGDGLCLRCHSEAAYETPRHSHHDASSPRLQCTSCHMPARTYMGVDVRHDHSFRVPRPDLAVSLGTPNACNDCHNDRSAEWAAAAVEHWYGPGRKGFQNFAAAFEAARRETPDAPDLLDRVASDPQTTSIARATALAEMAPYLTPNRAAELRQGLRDADPLVRLGALRGLEQLRPDQRWSVAGGLLSDPVRAVRVEAAAFLAETPMDRLSPEDRRRFEQAAQEYIEAQRFNADRPEARVTLGSFFARRHKSAEAEAEYRAAIRLSAQFIPAYVDLADLYRGLDRDRDGEAILREALAIAPDDAAAQHALGLTLVRQHRLSEAMPLLAGAAAREPRRARYAFVYAIALNSSGRRDEALRVLEENCARHPADRDTLFALISLERHADRSAALRHAEVLAHLAPGDPALNHLVEDLRTEAQP